MWGRTSSGRENGARFTAGHPYEVGGALGPVPGHSGGERCASPNPIPPQVGQSGKGVKSSTPARGPGRAVIIYSFKIHLPCRVPGLAKFDSHSARPHRAH
jgi:hypothetical protein